MSPSSPETFPWGSCAESLAPFVSEPELEVDAKGRSFRSPRVHLHPPLVLPIPDGCASLADYLDGLPEAPPLQTEILMQAGAVSLGLFERGEPIETKSFRRYVVRGKGRAQPTHLGAKGKSRYGSRLRLQNARRLLAETNEKLHEWTTLHGPSEHVFYSCPVRLWPDLFHAKPGPPFDRDDPVTRVIRIPLDLPKPTTELVLRTYRKLGFGRIERREPNETA